MKHFFIFLIISAFVFSTGFIARDRIFYDNPENLLIITHPDWNSRETISSRMSFLGDSDISAPLFINGKEIARTPSGFFTYYAELELGENVFVIVNGEHIETIVITRNEAGIWTPPETFYFTQEIFGSTESDFISRFAYFDDDLHGRTPLMSGTTFRILGERGDMYVLGDGTMVFQNSVFQINRAIRDLTVSGGEVIMNRNRASVNFNVTDNPLYEVLLNGNTATLILYADIDESELRHYAVLSGISSITKSAQESPSAIIYDITFEREPIGFLVDFSGGRMNIIFRFRPASLSEAVVLLDAGHGGTDPGALGPPGELGAMEKDFNFYVAEIARDYLESLGVNVIFLRDKDEFINIFDRIAYFDLEPDIVVSVHANSMPLTADFSSVFGPLMFYTLEHSGQAADDMIRLIIAEMSDFLGTSTLFTSLPDNTASLPHRRRNFAMARYTGGPSMLFEMGFLCNPEEYELLLNLGYLDRMGKALGMSIAQWLTGSEQLPINSVQLAVSEPQTEIYKLEEDALPVFMQSPRIYRGGAPPFRNYIVLVVSVLICGLAFWLPNVIKRR
ncbi:MAG: N-acetylmuramoyl-L-alanine amidase [Oscillospiraceae bacterium]|nr:N-acetylmuramoyl-L-alanine amidase [Oscillospiraceae bacterium]